MNIEEKILFYPYAYYRIPQVEDYLNHYFYVNENFKEIRKDYSEIVKLFTNKFPYICNIETKNIAYSFDNVIAYKTDDEKDAFELSLNINRKKYNTMPYCLVACKISVIFGIVKNYQKDKEYFSIIINQFENDNGLVETTYKYIKGVSYNEVINFMYNLLRYYFKGYDRK